MTIKFVHVTMYKNVSFLLNMRQINQVLVAMNTYTVVVHNNIRYDSGSLISFVKSSPILCYRHLPHLLLPVIQTAKNSACTHVDPVICKHSSPNRIP